MLLVLVPTPVEATIRVDFNTHSSNQATVSSCVITQKTEELSSTAAEAYNLPYL